MVNPLRKLLALCLLLAFLVVAVIIGVLYQDLRSAPPGLAPYLLIEPPTKDLGVVSKSQDQQFSIFLVNKGRSPITIEQIQACGCLSVTYDKQPIKPGEHRAINVMFTPVGLHGKVHKKIAIRAKDTVEMIKMFEFTATVE
jgi:hypothetical protein